MTRLVVLFAVSLAACASNSADSADFEADDAAGIDGKADSLASTSTYYVGRPDLRRCVSPYCGGTWVHRANFKRTRCADGNWSSECYVFDIDVQALQVDDYLASTVTDGFDVGRAVLRGKLAVVAGNTVASLIASEAWLSTDGTAPASGDLFYRATDSIRCLTTPCNAIHVAKLNSTIARNVDVDLSTVPGSDEDRQAATDDLLGQPGLVIAAHLTKSAAISSQAYRRVRPAGSCGAVGDGTCGPGLLCCFPCGIQPDPDLGGNACHNQCMPPQNGTNHCPLFQ